MRPKPSSSNRTPKTLIAFAEVAMVAMASALRRSFIYIIY
jgi:hypothetical protein